MNNKQEFEFAELFERVVNGDASEQQVKELETLIMTDSEALSLYQDLSLQHSHLQMTEGGGAGKAGSSQWRNRFLSLASIAALLLLSALLWVQLSTRNKEGKVENPSIATITSTSLAQWGQCSLATTLEQGMQQGDLELLQGTATLTFASGAIVSLEAPAKIKLISDMHALVKYGRVVAEVPEGAIGFRLDTPNLEVKDLGTVFAVSVDRDSGASQVDVIDGEVEVFHEPTENRQLLHTNHRVTIDEGHLDRITNRIGEVVRPFADADGNHRWTLSTADGAGSNASIISDHRDTHLHPHLLQAKNPINGLYARKFYLKFDLSSLQGKAFSQVGLLLNQVQSPYGYSSFVADSTFVVYALRDDAKDDWNEAELSWSNAPANDTKSGSQLINDDVIELGTFMIPRGQQEGDCYMESKKLVEILKDDPNGILTIIVVRETSETRMEGLVHTFAGNQTPYAEPPRLIITAE